MYKLFQFYKQIRPWFNKTLYSGAWYTVAHVRKYFLLYFMIKMVFVLFTLSEREARLRKSHKEEQEASIRIREVYV